MHQNREILHFHLFCGLGGGAKGFNQGEARVGSMRARFRCLGGVDSDPAAIADFGRLAGVPGTVLDLFDREQYRSWHGHEPPRRLAGGNTPGLAACRRRGTPAHHLHQRPLQGVQRIAGQKARRIGSLPSPQPAAAAIASEMGRALLLAWSGETFALGSTPIWVRPLAVSLAVSEPASVEASPPRALQG